MVSKFNIYLNGRPLNFGDKMKRVHDIYKNWTTEIIRTDVWKRLETSWEFMDQGIEFAILFTYIAPVSRNYYRTA